MRIESTLFLLLATVSSAIVSAQSQDEIVARGAYLADGILGCGNCHTPKSENAEAIADMKFAGAFVIEEPGVKAYASNITMDIETGIGSWSDEEIIRGIRDGIRPDGTLIGPPMPSKISALH